MNIDYTVNIWREGDQYVAHAMPLDVASAGPDPDAAREAVDEAVRAFTASCARAGTLTEVLEDAGYERDLDGTWRSPSGSLSSNARWFPEICRAKLPANHLARRSHNQS